MNNRDDIFNRDLDADGGLPVNEVESLLAAAPEEEALSVESRRQIWNSLEAKLGEMRSEQVGVNDKRSYFPLRSAQRIPVAVLSLAAVVMLAFGVSVLLFGRHLFSEKIGPALATIDVVRGGCMLVSRDRTRPAGVATSVCAGESLRISPEGGVRLAFADGSLVWLCGGSEIKTVSARGTPGQPVFRLVRGEFRAEVAHWPGKPFAVETAGATLRVLGTEFNCRVFPSLPEESSATKRFRNALGQAIGSPVVLTVLSGAVEVQAAGGQEVVRGGERTLVTPGSGPSAREKMENPDYTANWLSEPGEQAAATTEALITVPVREYLLHQLWAVSLESGKARHVTDLVGCIPRVVQQFGSGAALVKPSSVLLPPAGDSPVGQAGRPLAENGLMLVNLQSGEKVPVSPLQGCDVRYFELSPDRRKLAFLGSRKDTNTTEIERGVFVLDLESMKLKLALKGGMATCPRWSPDSRWLVISKGEGYTNNHRLVLIDTLMGEVRDTGFEGAGAVFSPNGQQLVFSGDFKQRGSWAAGVPIYGNLLAADLPNGKPRPLTSLPQGGAVFPRFSPDGSRLTWWETNKMGKGVTHVLDVSTGEDRAIAEGLPYEQLQWLNANSRLLFRAKDTDAKKNGSGGDATQLALVDLSASVPSVRRVAAQLPEQSSEQTAAANAIADRLLGAFSTYRDAMRARNERHTDRAAELLAKSYQSLKETSESLKTPSPASGLSFEDLAPYLETFRKEASKTPPGS